MGTILPITFTQVVDQPERKWMGLCALLFTLSICNLTYTFFNPSLPPPMDDHDSANGTVHRSTSPSQPRPTINGHPNHHHPTLGSPQHFIGKHRLAAIISQQNQQIQIIQEELDQLETLGESSLVCQQLLSSVESSTDALLPVTRGPADGGWDRWFQRSNQSSSRNRKRWI